VDDDKTSRLRDVGNGEDAMNAGDVKPFIALQISGMVGPSNLEQLYRKTINGESRNFFFSSQLVE
jgi:hypothetical protein